MTKPGLLWTVAQLLLCQHHPWPLPRQQHRGGSYVYSFHTHLGNAPNPPIYPYVLEALPKTKRIVTAPKSARNKRASYDLE